MPLGFRELALASSVAEAETFGGAKAAVVIAVSRAHGGGFKPDR
jgi:hypothetical protein